MLPSIPRRLPSVRHRWPVAALLVLAMVAAPGPAGASTPDPAEPGPDGAPAGATDRTPGVVVTLVTGDRVHVERVAGGRQAVTVDPAARPGTEPWFQTSTYQGQVYVIPSDAAPLVPGTLDRELFNVTKLAEAGYTDAVPVIVTGDPPAGSRTLAAPAGATATAGATVTADLPSIDGQALTVAPDGQWWRSRSSTALTAAATATAESERVWLDEPVAATLDESVPLVGAPAAWDAGFDGTGMTVAVLDTGIDASHPDLAGKVVAAENFSEFSDTTTDRFGHGTHVAGIVAGTGAVSGGTYRGVAPGASLMNGKVLGDDGFGLTSDIIEGMQWAVTNGADVVNMSLGGEPSDGTDPLSQAVNQITAEHGVLFVISAGNQLPADHTVTSPGAADAALTVGSVDKAEQLAFDSGRGPRLGDFAIKPDLTAPGVAIASARADGTALGPIVDEHYTVISGTSMAAPHVAAGAAILLQQDPTLDPAGLKAALATTAVPSDTLDVYQQGGGRLDLPAALAAPVRANPSPLDLGYFRFPHEATEPVSADVTYTNRTDAPVTLDLSLAVQRHESGPGGPPPGPGPLAEPAADSLSVSPATLTVPAGGTATATVTVDVRVGEPGVYGGYLVAARDGTPVTRTPVGFYKEAESYQLTIQGTARDGRPAAGSSIVNVMDVRDTRRFLQTAIRYAADGTVNLRVPAGVYSILGVTFSYGDDLRYEQERVFVGDPEVEVTGDTTVELDARDAHPVTVQTPDDPGAAPIQRVQFAHYRAAAEFGAHDLTYIGPVIPEYAMATEPVTLGAFEYYTRWRIAEPQLALSVTEPAEQALSPWEMDGSPAMDGDLWLPLVDAGLGAAEDYQGIDAEGAIVLTQRGGPDDATKEATARAAGAAALVVANHQAGNYRSFVADDAQIPAMTVSRADGDALRALLATGPVTLRLAGNPASPYLYDVVLPEPGQVPEQPHYRVRRSELATVEATFHSDAAAGHRQGEVRHFFRPWADSSFGIVLGLPVPLTRTELLVGGDTRYRQQISAAGSFTGLLEEPLTTYQPGEHRQQSWFAPVNRPGFLDEHEPGSDLPSVRDGDSLVFAIPEWVDGYGHWGPMARGVDTAAARLYADGVLVGESTRSSGRFPVAPEPATYRFEVDVDRAAPWWSTATGTRTAWTFQSARPAGDPEPLPLLTVDADPGADLRNTVPGGPRTIGLQVGHQPGADAPAIEAAQLWVSYDDGGSWQEAAVRETGTAGQFEADLPAPTEPDGFASLRVSATDVAGNRIEQEVTRAWRFAGPACDRTVTGVHIGPLLVADGVTCLADGARVVGSVQVRSGAGLVSTGASVVGAVSAARADLVQLSDSTVTGPVSVVGTGGRLELSGTRVTGPVSLVRNHTGAVPIVVSGNVITGVLLCVANRPAPVDKGVPNQVTGPAVGQCAPLAR